MISADPRAAVDFAIAEAFKRMAPDDYKPVPDAPVPMDSFNPRRQSEAAASRGAQADGDFSSPLKDEQPLRAASPIPGTYTHTPGA